MEKKLITRFSKKGYQSPMLWIILLIGLGLLYFIDEAGIISLIFGLPLVIVSIIDMNNKMEIAVYNTGFEYVLTFKFLFKKQNEKIDYNQILFFKGEINDQMRMYYIDTSTKNMGNDEMKHLIHDGKGKEILFDAGILEKKFKLAFFEIEKQFRNYVFDKYNYDVEKVEKSVYLFEQINNDFLEVKGLNSVKDYVNIFKPDKFIKKIDLLDNRSVKIKYRYKNYYIGIKHVSNTLSYEPKWYFADKQEIDTVNIINRELIKEILIRKYNIEFLNIV